MLILILIDVQYSQKAVFSFEKGLNGQNHSSSGSHHLVWKSHQQNFWPPYSHPLNPQIIEVFFTNLVIKNKNYWLFID